MKQEFHEAIEGGVAGRDIINGDKTTHTRIHIETNHAPININQHCVVNEPLHIYLPPGAAKPKVKVVIQPGPDCIDEEQKNRLKALVAEVIRLEGLLKRTPRSFSSVWIGVNARAKASSYHLITQANYPRAEKFLREWIGRLSSAKSAHTKDANWRNRKFSYIFVNVRELDANAALRKALLDRFGNDSLKALSDADLESIYHLVAGWKQAGHAPGQAKA